MAAVFGNLTTHQRWHELSSGKALGAKNITTDGELMPMADLGQPKFADRYRDQRLFAELQH